MAKFEKVLDYLEQLGSSYASIGMNRIRSRDAYKKHGATTGTNRQILGGQEDQGRDVVTPVFEENKKYFQGVVNNGIANALDNPANFQSNIKGVYDAIGKKFAEGFDEYISSGRVTPGLTSKTIKIKKHWEVPEPETPLYRYGDFKKSIIHTVEKD